MPSLGLKLLDREFSLATDRAVSRRIRKRFEEKRKKPGFGDEPPAFGDISWATRMNRPDLVEKHVEEGIHVNVTRWSGFMPLHRAAGEGNTEALEKLLLHRLGAARDGALHDGTQRRVLVRRALSHASQRLAQPQLVRIARNSTEQRLSQFARRRKGCAVDRR